MDIEKRVTPPDIAALSLARESADRARALESISGKRTLAQRAFVAVVGLIPLLSLGWMARFGLPEQLRLLIFGIEVAMAAVATLAVEVYRLRQRLNAVTLLLLQEISKPDSLR